MTAAVSTVPRTSGYDPDATGAFRPSEIPQKFDKPVAAAQSKTTTTLVDIPSTISRFTAAFVETFCPQIWAIPSILVGVGIMVACLVAIATTAVPLFAFVVLLLSSEAALCAIGLSCLALRRAFS